jgi:flagellum-specific ATP synthase
MDEPIADISRATRRPHRAEAIARERGALRSTYSPAFRALSRVASKPHNEAARRLRGLLAAFRSAGLISIGAYVRGADAEVDRAVDLMPAINAFLRQQPEDVTGYDDAVAQLLGVDPEFAPRPAEEAFDGTFGTAAEAAGGAS